MACPVDALGRSVCARTIVDLSAATQDTEITASTARPLVASPYGENSIFCPHGVEYWIEPTSEQITAWNRDQVR